MNLPTIPEGYELVTVTNTIEPGVQILLPNGLVKSFEGHLEEHLSWFIVIRPIPKWRTAKPNDLLNGVFKARVKNIHTGSYIHIKIVAYHAGAVAQWEDHLNRRWSVCEIEDHS